MKIRKKIGAIIGIIVELIRTPQLGVRNCLQHGTVGMSRQQSMVFLIEYSG